MQTALEPWSPAVRTLTSPWAADRRMPRIRLLRVVTLAVVTALVLMGVVLLFTVDIVGTAPTGWLYGWAGFSALSLPVGYYARTRRNEHFVRTAKVSDAYGFYRTRMMLGLAIAEIPAVIGFAFSFPADSIVPYLLGMAVSLFRIAQHGPTAVDVTQMQGWLDEFQDPFDLAGVLMEPVGSAD